MAPLGLKPNSPDYRFRNCTSSKWDLNPYAPFIESRGGRAGPLRAPAGTRARAHLRCPEPAPATATATATSRPASPPPLPQRQELLFALLIYF